MFRMFAVLTLAGTLSGLGCRRAADLPPGASGGHTNRQTYEVRGLVLEVKPLEKSVIIKHEAVPGYMPAMTMPFDVKDTNELAGVEPGEPVAFRLTVTYT
jgi:Cu/Ag efflux protein CusF